MPKFSTVFSIVDTAGGYKHAEGWMSCDACPRRRIAMRPACGCSDTVVDADDAACLPTTAAPASRQGVAAAGTEAGDRGM